MNVSCPECQSVFRVDPARIPGPGIRARCSVCGGVIPIASTVSWTDDFSSAAPAVAAAGAQSAVAVDARARERAPTPRDAAPARSATPPASPAVLPQPSIAPSPEPSRAQATPSSTPAVTGTPTPPRVPPFVPARRATPPRGSEPAPQTAFGAPAPLPTPPSSRPVVAESAPASPAPRSDTPPPLGAPLGVPSTAGRTPVGPTPIAPTSAAPAHRPPINPFLANDPNQKAKRLARALVSDMVAYHPQKREEGLRAGTLKQLFREEIKKSYEEYVDQIGKEFAETTSHFQDALNDVLAGGRKIF